MTSMACRLTHTRTLQHTFSPLTGKYAYRSLTSSDGRGMLCPIYGLASRYLSSSSGAGSSSSGSRRPPSPPSSPSKMGTSELDTTVKKPSPNITGHSGVIYSNLLSANLQQKEQDSKKDKKNDGDDKKPEEDEISPGRIKALLLRWWDNKDVVAICTILAGAGTLLNVAQQNDQLERQQRLDEENRRRQAEEEARNSAERKTAVVRGALLVKMPEPEVSLPLFDMYEAEALLNRLIQRSPVLLSGYQGTGKSTLLSRMVAARRAHTDVSLNQPAYRLSLRKCLRDRSGEPGILFRILAEEIGLGKAVQEGFVCDDFSNAQRYFVAALEQLRRDGYEPCLFIVDDVDILFRDIHPGLATQAAGWCEWLLELHEAGLIRLVMATNCGSVYLDLIKLSGYETRLERATMPEIPEGRLVRYLLEHFNEDSFNAETSAFNQESAKEFARIFTGFTDILFAISHSSIHEYCEARIRRAQLRIKKAIQLDSGYREIFKHLPCEMDVLERNMPHMKLSALEERLDYLVDRGIIAWSGNKIVWNRKLVREAYNRMSEAERSRASYTRIVSSILTFPLRLFGYGS